MLNRLSSRFTRPRGLGRGNPLGLLIGGMLLATMIPLPGTADAPVMQYSVGASSYPLQKVMVRVVTPDPSDEPGVEFKFQEALADRNVNSGNFSQVFTSTDTPAVILQTMRRQGYNAYLCFWPRKVVHWDPSQAPPPGNPLEIFLAKTLTSTGTQNTTAVNATGRVMDPTFDNFVPSNDPISGDGGGDVLDVSKINASVYNVATGQRLWRGILTIRSSPDLRTYFYDKEFLQKAMGYMAGAGLIPE